MLFQNIPEDINTGEMKLYIEAEANAAITSTIFGLLPERVLIEFAADPGINVLYCDTSSFTFLLVLESFINL